MQVLSQSTNIGNACEANTVMEMSCDKHRILPSGSTHFPFEPQHGVCSQLHVKRFLLDARINCLLSVV